MSTKETGTLEIRYCAECDVTYEVRVVISEILQGHVARCPSERAERGLADCGLIVLNSGKRLTVVRKVKDGA